ncbi:MAG: hypothetical protein A2293_13960 [Elusimicrobia bacterium RIFOXYB2_FULL_49_7]|nr:MAG: hypothetical protein A2293_13960 [Elusimicrobia bacterium RIFOXYB2_FULL_49_7]
MKNLRTVLIVAVFVGRSLACSAMDYLEAEQKWADEETFLFQCLSTNPEKETVLVKAFEKKLKQRYRNLMLITQTLNIRTQNIEKANADKAPIFRFGTGFHGYEGTFARFEGAFPTDAQIDSVCTSPVKKEIIRFLDAKKVVLLVLSGKDAKTNRAFMRCAEKGKRMVSDILNMSSEIVECKLDDPREKYLVRNIFMKNNVPRPGILIVFGRGKGLHFVDDPSNEIIILDVMQMTNNKTNAQSRDLEARLLLDMRSPWK